MINFQDWPLERAKRYPDLMDIVRRQLEDLGRQLDEERRELMLSRSWGLTNSETRFELLSVSLVDPVDLELWEAR